MDGRIFCVSVIADITVENCAVERNRATRDGDRIVFVECDRGEVTRDSDPGSSSRVPRERSPSIACAAPTSNSGRPMEHVGAATSPRLIFPTRLNEAPLAVERTLPRKYLRRPRDTIRAIRGPQTDLFSEEATSQFFSTTWHIAPHSDRMGYRLGGGKIEVESGGSMISEGVCAGCVQIPAGGEPIVLMADCGTIGGYPKIATVISVDRGVLAQYRVGREFRFEEAGVETAHELLCAQAELLNAVQEAT